MNTVKAVASIAKDVYRTLGSGHSESVYDRAMQVGLRLAKFKLIDSQKVIPITYKGHHVGEGYTDIIVSNGGKDFIVLELKAVGGSMGAAEEQQLKNYLKILKLKHGILINFQQPGKKEGKTQLEFKEVSL